jgi:cystathionine beta-lyase/cystathionine gamma-synthase
VTDREDIGVLLAHFGEEDIPGRSVVGPIHQTSLSTFERTEDLVMALSQPEISPPFHYSRFANPTVEVAEKKIAALEGAELCKLTSGGISAIAYAILGSVRQGGHIIMDETAYGPTRQLAGDWLGRFGVTHTLVDGRDPENFRRALRPETQLIHLESPGSLLFRQQDVAAVSAIAHEHGAIVTIDSTYATPLRMRPLELGADIVLHSASKYMAGHSDITAGAICGPRRLLDPIIRSEMNLLGGLLHPFSGWLLTRGLRTLPMRLERSTATAQALAEWLEGRPEVRRVHHLGLASDPQAELFRRQMKGAAGLFSFEPVSQDRARIFAFCDSLRLFQRGISWGGHESLVVPSFVTTSDRPEGRWVVRLYCGIEESEALQEDLGAGLPLI